MRHISVVLVVAAVALFTGCGPSQASLLKYNQELVEINNELAAAGTEFGTAVGNSIRSGDNAGLQDKYATLLSEFEKIETKSKALKVPDTDAAKNLYKAHRNFMAGQSRMIKTQMSEILAVLHDGSLPQAEKESKIQTLFESLSATEQADLTKLQDAQKSFAEKHNIRLEK